MDFPCTMRNTLDFKALYFTLHFLSGHLEKATLCGRKNISEHSGDMGSSYLTLN